MLYKLILLMCTFIALLCGTTACQSVSHVEFYEPTKDNAAYSIPATETSVGHGPIKSIDGRTGVPNFSDNKSLNLRFTVLGL